jgi:hypothetical protein
VHYNVSVKVGMDKILETLLDNWVALVVLIGVGGGVITSIATQVRKYGTHRVDMQLKRELVERGLSAEEIERIVAIKSPSEHDHAEDS